MLASVVRWCAHSSPDEQLVMLNAIGSVLSKPYTRPVTDNMLLTVFLLSAVVVAHDALSCFALLRPLFLASFEARCPCQGQPH